MYARLWFVYETSHVNKLVKTPMELGELSAIESVNEDIFDIVQVQLVVKSGCNKKMRLEI